MKTVKVKDIIFNDGLPKICVPLIGKTQENILEEIKQLRSVDFDLVELRIDFYEDVENFARVRELLEKIREIYHKPLLFTFRTKKEGGKHLISGKKYFDINRVAIESRLIDLVDIELFTNEEKIKALIALAKENDVKVIMSNHDFDKTPSKEELLARLVKMQEYDADITKIAVMPNSEEDVMTLLNVTLEMKKNKGDRPTITMSMGTLGIISRLSGELFGSCMTFAAARESSAPGQVNVRDMRNILNLIHRG